ncbi:MAG: hypothetical protein NXI20_26830 [bacterium]|nr:hypothetical protein [bacterium]
MVSRYITFLAILALEIYIYLYANQLANYEPSLTFQLAARYSARLSFLLYFVAITFTMFFGLRTIFDKPNWKGLFGTFVLGFAINHLIHFGYLYTYHSLSGFEVFSTNNLPGALGYITLVVGAYFSVTLKKCTGFFYWAFSVGSLFIAAIFVVTYMRRLSKQYPLATSEWLIKVLLTLAIVSITMIAIRVLQDLILARRINQKSD